MLAPLHPLERTDMPSDPSIVPVARTSPPARGSSGLRSGRMVRSLAACLLALSFLALVAVLIGACWAHCTVGAPTQRIDRVAVPDRREVITPARDRGLARAPARTQVPPVRIADSGDAWVEALRDGSYWKARGGQSGASPSKPKKTSTAREWPLGRWGSSESRSKSARRGGDSNIYRTVCVRLCDGYFWPISFATARDNFERDSIACSQSCSSPAMLYHAVNVGGETADMAKVMVSLEGAPYTELTRAFHYRTTYSPSCKCRADPWEREAIERHAAYARDDVHAAARSGRVEQ